VNALSEAASFERFGSTLPRPPSIVTADRAEACRFAAQHALVVAKASGIAHKSDVGAVRLGLTAVTLVECFEDLAQLGDGRVLVTEQVRPDIELIVGALRDPQFGPLVTIGLGGVIAEALDDAVVMLAPPEPGELDHAIELLRGAAVFDGFRGRAPVDRQALASIVDAVAHVLASHDDVVEVDLNPVAIVEGRPLVLDCLVVTQ
jgi:acetate---CoA ligase (ADP-forming) subunit beta